MGSKNPVGRDRCRVDSGSADVPPAVSAKQTVISGNLSGGDADETSALPAFCRPSAFRIDFWGKAQVSGDLETWRLGLCT